MKLLSMFCSDNVRIPFRTLTTNEVLKFAGLTGHFDSIKVNKEVFTLLSFKLLLVPKRICWNGWPRLTKMVSPGRLQHLVVPDKYSTEWWTKSKMLLAILKTCNIWNNLFLIPCPISKLLSFLNYLMLSYLSFLCRLNCRRLLPSSPLLLRNIIEFKQALSLKPPNKPFDRATCQSTLLTYLSMGMEFMIEKMWSDFFSVT